MAEYVAAVQMDCKAGKMEENTTHAIRLLEELLKEEPGIVFTVFPEMALYGYKELEKMKTCYTQKTVEQQLDRIAAVCARYCTDVVIGAPFYGEAGIENALYFISKDKKVQHIYSKVHLIHAEQAYFQPGNTYGICDTTLGRFGFLICWDSAFAEAARIYAKEGVDALVICAAWETPYGRQWELAVCGRAFDNSVPVLAVNRTGTDGDLSFVGRSMIADDMGNICQEAAGSQEGYVIAGWKTLFHPKTRKDFGSQTAEMREDTYNSRQVRSFYLH